MYAQLRKIFKIDNGIFGIEQQKTEFQLLTNEEHVIVKIDKSLLKFEMEEVKNCMIKWAENFGLNIQMKQWEMCG